MSAESHGSDGEAPVAVRRPRRSFCARGRRGGRGTRTTGEEEEEPVGDVVADAVAAAVAADAWHYLEMLRLENDEELKKLKEEERQAGVEDLRNIPA